MGKSKDLATGAAYQDQTESDTRYVNASGDSMTGALSVNGGANTSHLTLSGTASRGLQISTSNPQGQNDGTVIFNAQDTEASGGYAQMRFQTAGTERVRLWPEGQVFFKNGVALHPLTIVNLTTSYQNIIDISSGGMTNSYGGFIAFSGENNYHQGWVITHSGNGFSAHYFGQSSGHTHSLDVQWQKSGSYIQAKKSYSTGRTISVFLAMGNSAGLYDF